MPWLNWKAAWTEEVPAGAEITFAFAPGEFTCNGVTYRPKRISIFDPAAGHAIAPAEHGPDIQVTHEAQGAFMGLPLVAAYRQTREHGIQPTLMNRMLLRQQHEVERVLEKAEKLLKPLGISRLDLERVLDCKIGVDGR